MVRGHGSQPAPQMGPSLRQQVSIEGPTQLVTEGVRDWYKHALPWGDPPAFVYFILRESFECLLSTRLS